MTTHPITTFWAESSSAETRRRVSRRYGIFRSGLRIRRRRSTARTWTRFLPQPKAIRAMMYVYMPSHTTRKSSRFQPSAK